MTRTIKKTTREGMGGVTDVIAEVSDTTTQMIPVKQLERQKIELLAKVAEIDTILDAVK